MLTKITVEAALNAELDDHRGFAKHDPSEDNNNRNGYDGYASKMLQTESGLYELGRPRNSTGSFKPHLVKNTNVNLPRWMIGTTSTRYSTTPKTFVKQSTTTNAIESLNSVIRKAIKKRKLFPADDSAKRAIYLAIQAASHKWSMPMET